MTTCALKFTACTVLNTLSILLGQLLQAESLETRLCDGTDLLGN